MNDLVVLVLQCPMRRLAHSLGPRCGACVMLAKPRPTRPLNHRPAVFQCTAIIFAIRRWFRMIRPLVDAVSRRSIPTELIRRKGFEVDLRSAGRVLDDPGSDQAGCNALAPCGCALRDQRRQGRQNCAPESIYLSKRISRMNYDFWHGTISWMLSRLNRPDNTRISFC